MLDAVWPTVQTLWPSFAKFMSPFAEDLAETMEVLIDYMANRVYKRLVSVMPPEPKYYTRIETAEMLHISLPTLRSLAEQGRITPKRVGRKVLYNASEIDSLVNSREPIKYVRREGKIGKALRS